MLIILVAVISPVGVGVAHAFGVGDVVAWFIGFKGGPIDFLQFLVAEIVNVLFYKTGSLALYGAAFVFDRVVPFSLGLAVGTASNAFNSAFISSGWGLMRDITNIVFIFALLYIAIGTILQLGAGKNTRALLANVIVVALLVNFSLFFAKVVIDGANLLAYEFYKAMANDNGLAAIVINGFNPQKLLGNASFESWILADKQSYVILIFLYLFGGAVYFVSAYMIFWAAFLFIARIVMLWILMILAPLAFAAYIIPGMSGYFSRWWKELFNYAFVAPIFLFLFYIFAVFLHTRLPETLGNIAVGASADSLTNVIAQVALGFSLVIGFMFVILRVTKKYGGEAAVWATKASGAVLAVAGVAIAAPLATVAGAAGAGTIAARLGSYAAQKGVAGAIGRVAGVPLRPLASGVRGAIGEAAKGVVGAGAKQTVLGKVLRGTGVARLAGRAEAGTKAGVTAEIEQAEKDLAGLSENALATEVKGITTTAERRAGAIKILGKRGKLTPNEKGESLIDPKKLEETLETVGARGYNVKKEIRRPYLWQYATSEEDRKEAAENMSVEALKEIAKVKNKDGNPSNYFTKESVREALMKNISQAHFKVLEDPETNKAFADALLDSLKTDIELAVSVLDEVRKKLTAEGKTNEAAKIKNNANDYFKHVVHNLRGEAATRDALVQAMFDNHDIPFIKKHEKGEDEGGGKGAGGGGGEKKEPAPTIVTPPSYGGARAEEAPKPTGDDRLKTAAEIEAERAAREKPSA